MAYLPRANRSANPGAKRQRFRDLVGKVVEKMLLLPSDNSISNEHLTRTASNLSDTPPADPPALEPNSALISPSGRPQVVVTTEDDAEPQEQPVPIGRHPIGLLALGNVNPDDFLRAVNERILSPKAFADITMYGEAKPARKKPIAGEDARSSIEVAPGTIEPREDYLNTISDTGSNSSGDSEIKSKGFNAIYDTGATVSIISLKTLGRLRKSYTRFENLHEDQQIELGDYKKEVSKPLGVTSLLWYLDTFPKVIFNTTFWVVTSCDTDVVLGQDVIRAAVLAVDEAKPQRPRRRGMRTLVGSVNLIAHKVSAGRLSRHSSHYEDSPLRQEVIRAATGGVTPHV